MEEQILEIITQNGQSEDDNDALVIKYPPDLAKEITSHMMEFIEWKDRNTDFDRIDDEYFYDEIDEYMKLDKLFEYWLTNIKHP